MNQNQFHIGQRVRLVSVHHPGFEKEIGSILVVKKFAGASLWCSPDKLYPKRRRNGEILMEPPNWMTLYSPDQLDAVFIANATEHSGKIDTHHAKLP